MQHCCHRRGRHSGLRLVAAFLAHAVALAAAARIPAAVPLSHAKTSSSHSGNPANARAQRLDLAGAARSLLQSAAEDPVLPASPSLSPSPSSSPSPSLSPSPSSSPSPSPSPAPCGPHENPAAPYVPCGASPSPSPSPSPSLDPTLGSGSIKNSCGQPITFQAAYEVLSEQDGANCAELVPYFGPAASLFSELDPQGFLCLTGWEVIGPGETYQVPFATPIDPATGTQTPLLTRYPPCRLHNMFDKGYCSHHMSWWYTAHIATDEGTTYSLSRGKMGSSLRNATGMQLCWPAVPEECVWWVPLEPVQINYDPFKLGFDYQPNVLDWGTLGALELTCPDVAFNQSQGEPEQDPGPLPSDLAPLVVENACHSPIAFAAGFLLQQPYEQHPCRVVMQVGNYDAACITDYVTIPEGETVQLDTVWKQEGLARSKGLLNWPLPYNLRVSAYVAGSSPQHWLTNTSEALVWDDVPTPGLLSGGASVLSTAMTGTIWTPLVDATPHWRGDEYIAGPVDLNMTRADGTVVIRCEGYEASR